MVGQNEKRSTTKKKKQQLGVPDYIIMALIIGIFAFGIVMVYSASFYTSARLGRAPASFAIRQLVLGGLGIVAMLFVTYCIDYHILSSKGLSRIIYGVSIALSVLVMLIGTEYNGAKRWISIAGIQFQPSEITKVAVIIMLATYLVRYRKKLGQFKYRAIAWAIFVFPAGLVAIENLSSAIVIFGIGFVMCFIAMPKMKFYIVCVGLGGLIVVGAWFLAMSTPDGEDPNIPIVNKILPAYRLDRIKVWLDPWVDADDKGYQPIQALYAVGSGGLFGRGLGNSVQKQEFLPEPYNDIIFAVICEELGLVGAVALIFSYGLLIFRGLLVAMRASDYFGMLLAIGVSTLVGVQVIINVAVNTNTIPTTGMQLPLVSYGGTAIAVLIATLGILLNVSRGANIQKVKK